MPAVARLDGYGAPDLPLAVSRRGLDVPVEKCVVDMADTGNLVSASIPVAISRAQHSGRIAPGQRLVVCGFGVGLSWATALVQT